MTIRALGDRAISIVSSLSASTHAYPRDADPGWRERCLRDLVVRRFRNIVVTSRSRRRAEGGNRRTLARSAFASLCATFKRRCVPRCASATATVPSTRGNPAVATPRTASRAHSRETLAAAGRPGLELMRCGRPSSLNGAPRGVGGAMLMWIDARAGRKRGLGDLAGSLWRSSTPLALVRAVVSVDIPPGRTGSDFSEWGFAHGYAGRHRGSIPLTSEGSPAHHRRAPSRSARPRTDAAAATRTT